MSLFYCHCALLVLRDSRRLGPHAKFIVTTSNSVMRQPSAAIGPLIFTLLISAWSNVIAACLCPRYSMDHRSHVTRHSHISSVQQESSCNHELTETKIDGISVDDVETTSQDSSNHTFVSLPGEQCTHCLMYSQPASGTATLVAVNPTNRLIETDVPLIKFEATLPLSSAIFTDPLEHGPPGNLFPRHVLLSVFRI